MRDEAEVEFIDSEHCDGAQNHNSPNETGALVKVTFQKNPNQELKYLEAEPKALGITQILLSVFIGTSITTLRKNIDIVHIFFVSLSAVGIIAGSVAIAAQSLHLPKLKACLGMQIVLCVLSVMCFILSFGKVVAPSGYYMCWGIFPDNYTTPLQADFCDKLTNAFDHVEALEMLVFAAQIAISSTLAAFCCKVIQCCSPRSSMAMIVLNAPPAPQ